MSKDNKKTVVKAKKKQLTVEEQKKHLESLLLKDGVRRNFEGAVLLDIYKKAKAQNIPESDFLKFVHTCQQTGANPTLNQAYLVPYTDYRTKVTTGQIFFHYSFLETVAQETGEYEGMRRETGIGEYFNPMTSETQKMLFCDTVVIRKGKEYHYRAWFNEFVKTYFCKKEKRQKPMGLWATMPYLMLEKCSLSNALRRAFPEAMAGIYSIEESWVKEQEEKEINEIKESEGNALEIYEAKQVELKKIKEKMENTSEQKEVIEQVKNELSRVTIGFPIAKKLEVLEKVAGCKSFAEVEEKDLKSLKFIYKELRAKDQDDFLTNAEIAQGKLNV